MKKTLCLALASLMLAAPLASCSGNAKSSAITVTSSDAADCASWLENRLGDALPSSVLGIGSNEKYDVDMSDFESDGYIIRESAGEVLVFGASANGLDRAVRKYAHTVEQTGSTAGLDVTYHEGARIKKLTIAGADISEYVVLIPEDANENMKFAAGEMIRLIEKATGIKLTIEVGTATDSRFAIRYVVDTDPALEYDGYHYEVTETGLTIFGAPKRGAMNGTWRFLQNELGWQQLIYGESNLVAADEINIPVGTTRSETPVFEYLEMYRHYWGSYNNDRATPSAAQNSYGVMAVACHGMHSNRFVSEDLSDHQVCYTSDLVYEECLENVQSYIDVRLEAGRVVGVDFFDVDIAHGDNSNFCKCKNCRAMFNREGSHSGAVVQFANRLSEEINESYGFDAPLYFKIFAYGGVGINGGTNIAPKTIVPNEYVHITFCNDMNCSNHKMDGSECPDDDGVFVPEVPLRSTKRNNKDFSGWLETWCNLTKNVYLWTYSLDTVLQQYSVIDLIYDDFQYLRSLGIKGVFWQCQFDGLGIQRVEHQLLSELNWNPDMTKDDFEALLCRLLENEFGSGWNYVREYINMWERSQDNMSCWHCWGWTIDYCWDTRYDVNFYAKHYDTMVDLFERAIALADSAAQEERVSVFSCHMYYEGCYSSYYTAEAAGDTERLAVLSDRYDLLMNRLVKAGFDPFDAGIVTVDGARNYYSRTIEEAGEKDWAAVKENLLAGVGGYITGHH